jgi:hypothetical protein
MNSNDLCAIDRLRIVVLGYIIRGPLGGLAWHHLQYVVGLALQGHDVLFLEDSDDYPSCYDPSTNSVGVDATYGLQFASTTFDQIGMSRQWAYFDAHQARWLGPAANVVPRFCAEADIVFNVSGVSAIRPWMESIPIRVLIDTDPAFTQVRHLADVTARNRALAHTSYFTFAESIGQDGCSIPDDGFNWLATRQPVVLGLWPIRSAPSEAAFTTVMQWDSYPAVEYGGRHFGMKSESFDLVATLPKLVDARLEIALGGPAKVRSLLAESGWQVVDSLEVTRDPWTYQNYLQNSCGEFGVAKHGYVVSRSGWFSERTACYLASGRPAIVQDTGFSRHLPCGRGLLAFNSLSAACEAIASVQGDYSTHCDAAREVAAEYFDSGTVLLSLIERIYSTSAVRATK